MPRKKRYKTLQYKSKKKSTNSHWKTIKERSDYLTPDEKRIKLIKQKQKWDRKHYKYKKKSKELADTNAKVAAAQDAVDELKDKLRDANKLIQLNKKDHEQDILYLDKLDNQLAPQSALESFEETGIVTQCPLDEEDYIYNNETSQLNKSRPYPLKVILQVADMQSRGVTDSNVVRFIQNTFKSYNITSDDQGKELRVPHINTIRKWGFYKLKMINAAHVAYVLNKNKLLEKLNHVNYMLDGSQIGQVSFEVFIAAYKESLQPDPEATNNNNNNNKYPSIKSNYPSTPKANHNTELIELGAPSDWQCDRCVYVNDGSSRSCKICKTIKPVISASLPPIPSITNDEYLRLLNLMKKLEPIDLEKELIQSFQIYAKCIPDILESMQYNFVKKGITYKELYNNKATSLKMRSTQCPAESGVMQTKHTKRQHNHTKSFLKISNFTKFRANDVLQDAFTDPECFNQLEKVNNYTQGKQNKFIKEYMDEQNQKTVNLFNEKLKEVEKQRKRLKPLRDLQLETTLTVIDSKLNNLVSSNDQAKWIKAQLNKIKKVILLEYTSKIDKNKIKKIKKMIIFGTKNVNQLRRLLVDTINMCIKHKVLDFEHIKYQKLKRKKRKKQNKSIPSLQQPSYPTLTQTRPRRTT